MIGFTIANEQFLDLAIKAGESFTRHTGLPYIVIRVTGSAPHINKLRLYDYLPKGKTGVFFDADTRFVRDFDFRQFQNRPEFFAVKDIVDRNTENCVFVRDCKLHGLNRSLFFNSGFFIWNHSHNHILEQAFKFSSQLKVEDWGEQTVLNAAVQRSGVDLALLPNIFNSMVCFESKRSEPESIMIHAAGVGPTAEVKSQYLSETELKYLVKRR